MQGDTPFLVGVAAVFQLRNSFIGDDAERGTALETLNTYQSSISWLISL